MRPSPCTSETGVLVDEVEYGASKVIQVTRCDAVAWVVIK
jgi:hypothetical protein